MAKNKYPEETVNLILDVSLKLFIAKGYDNTSIQDIIDHLGGLSKGAIYHHFKSKESILLAVYKRISNRMEVQMKEIRDNKQLNGMKKLQMMFASSLDSVDNVELFAASPKLLDNPKLLSVHIKSIMEDVVPNYVEPVIREGVQDGSIQTKYPAELAQIMIILSNIWLNPLVYPMTKDEVEPKIALFKEMMTSMGISFMNDQLVKDRLEQLRVITDNKN